MSSSLAGRPVSSHVEPSPAPPSAPASVPPSVDGRTARRDRNRDAVLDAVLELFVEGHFEPGAAEIADRSGVSQRSVFRYFPDRDTLIRAAMARHLERVAPLLALPDPASGPLERRIERLVEHRLRFYGAVAASARAAEVRASANDLIRVRLRETRSRLSRQVADVFAPELGELEPQGRRRVVVAVDALLQFGALEHLHVQLELPPAEVREVLVRSIGTLLADRAG